jgi:hypothetical protein
VTSTADEPIRPARFLYISMFGALVLFGSWAASLDASDADELDSDGVRVEAAVVRTRSDEVGAREPRHTVYLAQVTFEAEGERIEGEVSIDEDLSERLAEGRPRTLEIVYEASDPRSFRHTGFNTEREGEASTASWVMGAIGGSLVLLGPLLMVRAMRRLTIPR